MRAGLNVDIGTYTRSGGAGLVPLAVRSDGSFAAGAPFAGARNASFAVSSAGHALHYLVDEAAGMIGVHRREDGGWTEVARIPSGGSGPCYVALDSAERRLAVANYDSGHAALFDLTAEGLPVAPPALFRLPGQGPVAERQEGPHAHCVRFADDGNALYLVDLGADRVTRLELTDSGFGTARPAYRAPAGSGPRHLLFHPERPLAVLLSELASTLTLLEVVPDGGLRPVQVLSTLPDGFAGDSLGGHLGLSRTGTRVYATNRGHNSIAVFELDVADRSEGSLALLQHVSSGGDHPRHFRLIEDATGEGGALVVAHEQDGLVALFAVDAQGRLTRRGDGMVIEGACCVI